VHELRLVAAVLLLQGMRKRVGFQYNADEDTVEDVTMEMLENLSLMPQQVGGGAAAAAAVAAAAAAHTTAAVQ
jgi:hypothetical protein